MTVVETRGMVVTSIGQRLQGQCRTLISMSYGGGGGKGLSEVGLRKSIRLDAFARPHIPAALRRRLSSALD